MNSKRNSLVLVLAAVAVLVAAVWFGGGALWHMLLKMHGHG